MTEIDLSKLERIAQHMPLGDDLILITLKGHLLVEEALDEVLASYCNNPAALDDGEMGFGVKLRFARALTGAEELQFVWKACERLNSLRNALAHKLEHPASQKRLQSFLSTFDNHDVNWEHQGSQVVDLRRAIIFLIGAVQGIHKPRFIQGLGIAV